MDPISKTSNQSSVGAFGKAFSGWDLSWGGWLDNRQGEWWLLVQIVLILAHFLPPWPSTSLLGYALSFPIVIIGTVLFFVGVIFGGQAFWCLGPSLSPLPDPKPGSALVTMGPYGRCRHPIYQALLLCSVGVAMAIGSLLHMVLFFALCYLLKGKALREERKLSILHHEYRSYIASTPAILPGLPWLDWRS